VERSISVERLPGDWWQGEFDIALAAVGYETRSRYVFETRPLNSKIKAGAAFDVQQVLAFDDNLAWYRSNGFIVDVVTDSEYAAWFQSSVEKADSPKDSLRVVVDISSLSRVRIADIISVARRFAGTVKLIIDFVYSLALFTPPPTGESSNSHVGPVTNDFAGWWSDPDRRLSVVVGVGYEQDKALGAVEYLEAQDIWVFEPRSVIEQYTVALQTANATLMSMTDPNHRFTYRVQDPLDCFSRMQSLVQGLIVTNNVVLLPFGPKLIVLCSLIVAARDKRVAVWRVSAQASEAPVDRHGSENIYGLRVSFT
jgi:hypothetical protein